MFLIGSNHYEGPQEGRNATLSPALHLHNGYGTGSQTPSLMVQNLESFLTFTLAMGCSPAPPKPRSSVTKSKMPSEAWGTVSVSSSRRQKLYVSIGKTVPAPSVWESPSPGTQPHNCSGPCSGQYGLVEDHSQGTRCHCCEALSPS